MSDPQNSGWTGPRVIQYLVLPGVFAGAVLTAVVNVVQGSVAQGVGWFVIAAAAAIVFVVMRVRDPEPLSAALTTGRLLRVMPFLLFCIGVVVLVNLRL